MIRPLTLEAKLAPSSEAKLLFASAKKLPAVPCLWAKKATAIGVIIQLRIYFLHILICYLIED